MITVRLDAEDDFDGWRDQARALAAKRVSPENVIWQVGADRQDLFANESISSAPPSTLAVPRAFLALAKTVTCNASPDRFALLYRLLFDLLTGTCRMDDDADPLIGKLNLMAKAVRRDIHKMRAFLRFRKIEDEGTEHFIAWYEPEHHILSTNASFFMSRFANMHWSILTPQGSVHWDRATLHAGPAARREDAPSEDAVEAQWHIYYKSIFNPARLKVGAMLKEMPKKYWRNMPETAFVPEMIAGAQARMAAMIETPMKSSAPRTYATVKADAGNCRRCPLWAPATQMVFGEGPPDAALMLVGEQPGDEEDLAGRPFVGPAGRLLDQALEEAGIERDRTYITNAVKHFKYEQRGKRRIHQRPNVGEVNHCRWWLTQEIELVKPRLIVALGATALRSLTGKTMAINVARNQRLTSEDGVPLLATVHPSFLLRLPDPENAAEERIAFVRDLANAKEMLTLAA